MHTWFLIKTIANLAGKYIATSESNPLTPVDMWAEPMYFYHHTIVVVLPTYN